MGSWFRDVGFRDEGLGFKLRFRVGGSLGPYGDYTEGSVLTRDSMVTTFGHFFLA